MYVLKVLSVLTVVVVVHDWYSIRCRPSETETVWRRNSLEHTVCTDVIPIGIIVVVADYARSMPFCP